MDACGGLDVLFPDSPSGDGIADYKHYPRSLYEHTMRNRRLGELLPKQTMFLRLIALDFGRASKTPCAGASGTELSSMPTYGMTRVTTINARCTCD